VVAKLAEGQQGVVSHGQLVGLGVGASAIQRRVRAGRLHRVHLGVYLVGHLARAPHATEMAALLACGEAAVLSHRSAAFVWSAGASRPPQVHVTVGGDWSARRPGVVVHRSERLEQTDVEERHGLKLTSAERTILDLAAVLSPAVLEWFIGQAFARRLVSPAALAARAEASLGWRGIRKLRAALDLSGGPSYTRSPSERTLRGALRRSELPAPEVNVIAGRYELDFLWRAERLVVEVDGYTYHSDPVAFERDRLRDAELQASGYRVMRVTRRQVRDTPEAVIARIRRALGTSSGG